MPRKSNVWRYFTNSTSDQAKCNKCDKTLSRALNKCNCRNKHECPLQNKCLVDNIVYEASVELGNEVLRYVGATGNSFKKWWANHTRSFRDPGLNSNLIFNVRKHSVKVQI